MGPPSLHTRGLRLEPRGQVVSLTFFRHVFMFLQPKEGHGFPDQNVRVSSEGEKKQSKRSHVCGSGATVEKTTHIGFSKQYKKELWENASKKKPQMELKEQKPQILSEHTCCEPSHARISTGEGTA